MDVEARVTVAGKASPVRLCDVCRDAALVEAAEPLPLGTVVSLAMELPGTGGPLEVTGSVVRVAAGEGGHHGLAILFGDISAAAGARIDFFVATREG